MKACCVCGASIYARLRHWHNRDLGYSICVDCVGWLRRRKDYDPKEFEFLYGREGQHYPRVVPACENCGLSRQDTMIAARALGMVENPVCCEAHSFTCGKHSNNDDQECYSCFLARRENAKPEDEQIVFRAQ